MCSIEGADVHGHVTELVKSWCPAVSCVRDFSPLDEAEAGSQLLAMGSSDQALLLALTELTDK